jgi:hypothetical protein
MANLDEEQAPVVDQGVTDAAVTDATAADEGTPAATGQEDPAAASTREEPEPVTVLGEEPEQVGGAVSEPQAPAGDDAAEGVATPTDASAAPAEEAPVRQEDGAQDAPAEAVEAPQPTHGIDVGEEDYAEVIEDPAAKEVARFGDHGFTQADLDDVTRIQSVFRRQQAKKVVDDRAAVKREREAEAAATHIEPITMPEDDDDDRAVAGQKRHAGRRPAASGVPPADVNAAAKQRGGQHPKFQSVDYSQLHVKEMSADTEGMQIVYKRMLNTKDWW